MRIVLCFVVVGKTALPCLNGGPREDEMTIEGDSKEQLRAELDALLKRIAELEAGQAGAAKAGLKRTVRSLRTITNCNQAIARAEDETSLLDDICRIVVEEGNYPFAWVGFAMDDAGRTVLPSAWAGKNSEYLKETRFTWGEDAHGRGPTGTAIRTNTYQINRAASKAPEYDLWREQAAKSDFAASIALPLNVGGKVAGALNIYSGDPEAFDVDEVRLLAELAEDVSFGLEAMRNRAALAAAEEKQKRSEEYFRLLVETAYEGIWSFDEEWRTTFVNRRMAEMLGYAVEEMAGRAVTDFMPEEELADHEERRKQREDGKSERYERRLTRKDGSEATFLVSGAAIKDERGNFAGTVGMFTDITDRYRAQEELKQSEESYHALFDAVTDTIFVHHIENGMPGKFIAVNDIACTKLGYTREEMLQMTVSDIDAPESTVDPRPLINHILSGRDILFEQTHKTKDGRRIPVEIHARAFDFRGQMAILSVIRDITDRRKTEEEQLRLQKIESVGTLAGGIAHDFNNILTAVVSNISYAKSILDEDREDALDSLGSAERVCAEARKLTLQLLTFARGGAPILKSDSIEHLLRETAEFVLRGSRSRPEISLPPDLWRVKMDTGQISQVAQNLVINADQAMPNGGIVRISAKNTILDETEASGLSLKPGAYVRVAVADSGDGIPKENLAKIFDPYYTTKEKGHGLGLATVYSIVKKHNGHVGVESETGKGSVFTFYLPATPGTPESNEGESAKDAGRKIAGRILIMDDDGEIRRITGKALTRAGFDVDAAADGDEAVDLFIRSRETGLHYHAVILDLTIPGGKGGLETLSQLLRLEPELKAIVMSGYHNDPALSRYQDHGFRHAILKPFNAKELVKIVTKALAED